MLIGHGLSTSKWKYSLNLKMIIGIVEKEKEKSLDTGIQCTWHRVHVPLLYIQHEQWMCLDTLTPTLHSVYTLVTLQFFFLYKLLAVPQVTYPNVHYKKWI